MVINSLFRKGGRRADPRKTLDYVDRGFLRGRMWIQCCKLVANYK